VQARYERSSG